MPVLFSVREVKCCVSGVGAVGCGGDCGRPALSARKSRQSVMMGGTAQPGGVAWLSGTPKTLVCAAVMRRGVCGVGAASLGGGDLFSGNRDLQKCKNRTPKKTVNEKRRKRCFEMAQMEAGKKEQRTMVGEKATVLCVSSPSAGVWDTF